MTKNERAVARIKVEMERMKKAPVMIFKRALKIVGDKLVDYTPTYFDEAPKSGETKGAWRVSMDVKDSSMGSIDFSGETTKNYIKSWVQSATIASNRDVKVIFANNVPWSGMLEYGGYPEEVRVGSINTHVVPSYAQKRSTGGWSKDLMRRTGGPVGMVGKTVLEWPEIMMEAKRKTGD